jgi:hypothetical protein
LRQIHQPPLLWVQVRPHPVLKRLEYREVRRRSQPLLAQPEAVAVQETITTAVLPAGQEDQVLEATLAEGSVQGVPE